MALDLNNPKDAETFILDWLARGDPTLEREKLTSLEIEDGNEADMLRLAKQLFLYCDERDPLGRYDQPH